MQDNMTVGVVGLGLMGSSIATCILASGCRVIGVVKDLAEEKELVLARIEKYLDELAAETVLADAVGDIMERFHLTEDFSALAPCRIVIESIFEDVARKKAIYPEIEKYVSDDTVIGSNTSAIPVSILQEGLRRPDRFLGIHWAEPAHITRFMEIICGKDSDIKYAEMVRDVAESWRKEPSIVKKDIRGFITNRLMYALIREAFHLVEGGYATYEDVDRSLRNDLGAWITFAGPFRFMDLTGIPAYASVMKDLLPELDNSTRVPESMQRLVEAGAKGIANAHGFYPYTEASAKEWERCFMAFSYEIRRLSEKYPQHIGDTLHSSE